jgi:hypothetical protein
MDSGELPGTAVKYRDSGELPGTAVFTSWKPGEIFRPETRGVRTDRSIQ